MGHGNLCMPTAGSTGTEGNWSWMDFGCHETDAVAVTVAIAACTVTVRTWAQCPMPEISLHQHPKRKAHEQLLTRTPCITTYWPQKIIDQLFVWQSAIATFASDEVFIQSIPPLPIRNMHDHCKNITPLGIDNLRCKKLLILISITGGFNALCEFGTASAPASWPLIFGLPDAGGSSCHLNPYAKAVNVTNPCAYP